MRVTTVPKKGQPIDDVIDVLVWMRRKQPNEIILTFQFLTEVTILNLTAGGEWRYLGNKIQRSTAHPAIASQRPPERARTIRRSAR